MKKTTRVLSDSDDSESVESMTPPNVNEDFRSPAETAKTQKRAGTGQKRYPETNGSDDYDTDDEHNRRKSRRAKVLFV